MNPTPIKRPADRERLRRQVAQQIAARRSVVREHSPALAQLVRETRESGIHVEAWTVRGGEVR